MTKPELIKLICELLGIEKPNRMIETQITRFVTKHGYDYKDIGRALYYFVEVQKNKPDVSKGIGIVPFVKEESTAYFEKLKREQQNKYRRFIEKEECICQLYLIGMPPWLWYLNY